MSDGDARSRGRGDADVQALADEGINIQLIPQRDQVSVVIEEKYTELAVRALHAAFVEAARRRRRNAEAIGRTSFAPASGWRSRCSRSSWTRCGAGGDRLARASTRASSRRARPHARVRCDGAGRTRRARAARVLFGLGSTEYRDASALERCRASGGAPRRSWPTARAAPIARSPISGAYTDRAVTLRRAPWLVFGADEREPVA